MTFAYNCNYNHMLSMYISFIGHAFLPCQGYDHMQLTTNQYGMLSQDYSTPPLLHMLCLRHGVGTEHMTEPSLTTHIYHHLFVQSCRHCFHLFSYLGS